MSYPTETKLNINTFPHSFETGEQGDIKIYLPYRTKLIRVRSTVVKALAGTDSGTITVKRGATTIATLTHAASAAYGNEQDSGEINGDFTADRTVILTSAKTTVGGRVLVSLVTEIQPV